MTFKLIMGLMYREKKKVDNGCILRYDLRYRKY